MAAKRKNSTDEASGRSKAGAKDKSVDNGRGDDFLVVGIGASAGGIKALNEFFTAMPADSGMAFVVVLHLSPTHHSNLDAILQANTKMPVQQVTRTTKVEPDHVYVIPPNRNLVMVDGTVRLAKPIHEEGSRVAIDLFFRTLSESYERRAICVVMSGTGTDGTLGVRAIKGRNGFAIVQSPDDAEYDGMPMSAIRTKLVDVVLPAREIPEKLLSVRDSTEKFRLDSDDDGVEPPLRGLDALRDILTLVRVRTGHDFSNYKHPTLLRRIARHLQIHELDDMSAYLKVLREKPEEVQSLVHNLLINVTNFFRDKAAFDALEKEVLPKLFASRKSTDQIRIWVAGCATGEEAYSLAIVLCEYADKLNDPPKIQIFATDVDDDAVAQARDGRFVEAIETDVSPERLKRFFIKDGVHYRVKKVIREMVLFAPHNILRDPPFSRVDMVSCRNVLIYLNRETQERVLHIFHFALRNNGFLFLGSSESADAQSMIFAQVNKKYRIYSKRMPPGSSVLAAPVLEPGAWTARMQRVEEINRETPHSFGELHYKLIEQYAPPSVLVNGDFDIVHMSSSAGRFLKFSGGEPTRNIQKLVYDDLRADLRVALFSAQRDQTVSEFQNVRLRIDDKPIVVNLIVRPVNIPEYGGSYLLVIFDERDVPEAGLEHGAVPVESVAGDDAMQALMRSMEDELHRTKARLSTTIEQHETSVEELKASNEELQAINEELRSATEELETSKEELQSVNEELITVNQELKEKVDEVTHPHSDLQNLMESTAIATIFLDREFRVKSFTPQVADIFNIIPSDKGRPLEHITHKLSEKSLMPDAAAVLRKLATTEREVSTVDGRYFIIRFSPYRSADDKIEGVVLSFIDMTRRRLAEDKLRQREIWLRGQRRALEAAVNDLPLEESLGALVGTVLDIMPDGTRAAFYLANQDQTRLYHVVGMPPEYAEAVDGFEIGPGSLACGLATHKGEPVLTTDVTRDERWKPWVWLAEKFEYRGCWSFPIFTAGGKFIGTLAIYSREPREATDRDIEFASHLTHTAAIIISRSADSRARHQAEAELKASHEQLMTRSDELERFNKVAVGREMKMIELKKEVNGLLEELGRKPRYPLDFEKE